MADKNKKFKPKDRQEYLKAKIRKYGKNWKEHISSGDPGEWKEKPTPDATFGGKRIKKQGPEIKPFKIKQEPLAKNIRPKGLGHKAGGRIGLKRGSGRGGRMKDLPDHLRHSLVNQAKHKATHKSGGRTGLKHGGSVGAAIRGRGAEIK